MEDGRWGRWRLGRGEDGGREIGEREAEKGGKGGWEMGEREAGIWETGRKVGGGEGDKEWEMEAGRWNQGGEGDRGWEVG